MKIKAILIATLVGTLALTSCKKDNKDVVQNDMITTGDSLTTAPVAKDIDSTSAGMMTPSSLQNKDIDLSKDAITLNSVTEGNTDKAYLLFNEDQSKVEVFMPGESRGIIYDRKGSEGDYTWTDGKNELIQWKGYVLRTLKQATPLFAGDAM